MKTFKILHLMAFIALLLPTLATAQNWSLDGNNNAAANSFLGTTNAFALRLGTTAAQPLRLFTNNTEWMTLTSAGLLGIGTNAPSYRLHLTNSTNARSGYFTNTFVSNSATYGLYSETTNTGTGAEFAGYFRSNGAAGTNTGVDAGASAGATNYGLRSTVNGSSVATSTNYGLYSSLTPSTSTNNYGIYSTIANNATNHFSGYFNNGKVYVGYRLGIGINAPLAALHVSGSDNNGSASAMRITSGTQNLLLDGNEIDALADGLYLNNNTSMDVIAATGGGRVGIGTSSPMAKLHLNGDFRLENAGQIFDMRVDGDGNLRIERNGSTPALVIGDLTGRVGVGTTSPTAKLHVVGDDNDGSTGSVKITAGAQTMILDGNEIDATADGLNLNHNTNQPVLLANGGGNVGIGVTQANLPNNYKLAVNGRIICEELRVQTYPWPDYVFSPEYQLPTLAEVEKYIHENRHLPGIPAATVVEKEGLAVGDMQRLMMEKIEELTLYMIQLKKENVELQAQMKALNDHQK